MKLASEALTKTLHMGGIERLTPVICKAGAPDDPLTDAGKKDLLERSLAGESIKITANIVAYIQRDTANRNAIRFKDSAKVLKAVAKSGVGTPFLVDHDQSLVASRGGTVLKSIAEKTEAGDWLFLQTVEFVKPWAVQGVLDGTIDRFSIGWYPSGPIQYRHNGKEIEGWPDHWPGDKLEDDTIVEWVYTSAELIEVSGVNVPAVVGTHIEGIKAALAANSAPQQQREKPKKELGMNSKLITILGLAATLSDDQIVGVVEELKSTNDRQAVELAAAKEQLTAAQAIADKAEAEAALRAEQKLEADIADLYKQGKLTHRRDSAGVATIDVMEPHLRKAHSVGGRDLFDELSSGLKTSVPAPELQSDDSVSDNDGTGYGEGRLARLRSSGMSPERHAELAAKHAQNTGRA